MKNGGAEERGRGKGDVLVLLGGVRRRRRRVGR